MKHALCEIGGEWNGLWMRWKSKVEPFRSRHPERGKTWTDMTNARTQRKQSDGFNQGHNSRLMLAANV